MNSGAPGLGHVPPRGGSVSLRQVPWWGVLSSAAAPVLMIGGWTVAAALQPGSFDQVTGTISALAGYGATDRWVMTLALLGVGICHVGTGLALRPAAAPGRLLLMIGGVATMVVAASPLPAGGGVPARHTIAAALGFITLALWPAFSVRRGHPASWALRPPVCVAASAVLVALLIWFGAELNLGGGQVGLSERVIAGTEALWPLVVVLTCYWTQGAGDAGPAGQAPDADGEVAW